MHIPKLAQDRSRWDQHREFHWQINSSSTATPSHSHDPVITVFQDGSLAVHYGTRRPEVRHDYPDYGISITSTTDKQCPNLLNPEGVKVPKAWLNDGGAQTLLIDHELGRAYSLDDGLKTAKHKLWCAALYAKAGAHPQTGTAHISCPLDNKQFVPAEQREHLAGLYASCRAEVALTGDFLKPPSRSEPRGKVSVVRLLEVSHWRNLKSSEQYRLFHHGIARPRIEYPYFVPAT